LAENKKIGPAEAAASTKDTETDETAVAKSETVPETKPETGKTAEQEPEKISDILAAIDNEEKVAPSQKVEPEKSKNIIETAEVEKPVVQQADKKPEQNSTPAIVIAEKKTQPKQKKTEAKQQEKPKTKTEKRAKAPKQKKNETAKQESKRTADTAAIKKREETPALKEKEEVKKTAVKQKVKPQQKPKSKKVDPFNFFAKNTIYYIRVGTFNGNPPKNFLRRVGIARFRYYVTKNRGPKSVLIGPYSSYKRANIAVDKIKRAIGIRGTIVKAKQK
jgi:cell division septation protein DedD